MSYIEENKNSMKAKPDHDNRFPLSQLGSIAAHKRSKMYIPLGVGSPGRLFDEVKNRTVFVDTATSGKILDIDGNQFVDLICGLGPNILGGAVSTIRSALIQQIDAGLIHGLASKGEADLASQILSTFPNADKIRFSCSGTEAVMTAIRVARIATGRSKIIKFAGCYHGHSDQVLVRGSHQASPDNRSTSDGIPWKMVADTIILDYNDDDALEKIVATEGDDLAAILVEPVATNMGLVPAKLAFIRALERVREKTGCLIIADEVVNGFRFRFGPVSPTLDLTPDLTTLGKIIGGGLPIGAVVGPTRLMDFMETQRWMFQAGTFASNPMTVAAGNATLNILSDHSTYKHLEFLGSTLERAVNDPLTTASSPYRMFRKGSLFSFILVPNFNRLVNQSDVNKQDRDLFAALHGNLMECGFLLPPTIEEPGFICLAHTENQMRELGKAASGFLLSR